MNPAMKTMKKKKFARWALAFDLRPSLTRLIAAIVALATAHACATTRTVTSLADGGAGTLRGTIVASAANDTINFAVTGAITLTNGEIVIGRNLNIIGPGANALTVSGNKASRVFNIATGIAVSISGLTISNGRNVGASGTNSFLPGVIGQGGGIFTSGTLTLSNCVVTGNAATGGQGGSDYSGHDGSYGGGAFGGAILNNQGTLTLTACSVSANQVFGGAGGSGISSGSGGAGGGGFGGAIYN